MELIALPAFTDNYIWMIHDGAQAVVVDPGDALVVKAALQEHSLQLASILLTHHHADHTGGVDELRQATGCQVIGPAFEKMPEPLQRVSGGELVQAMGHTFKAMDVPGHTAGHIAYYCDAFEGKPLLFCGDTLFSGGCGRLFEGTPAQMLASLDSLAVLPGETRVCCTHEYTLSNLRFARTVEPDNQELAQYEQQCITLRANHQFTLPSSIALELAINPFLRSRLNSVRQAVSQFDPQLLPSVADDAACFAVLREWKNQFK
ncbi:hydroxyacylglutathione hydrolase [Variovorax sp. PCZ-1]|uniref:hydroxyacylglutathione hydrolase n=1 Tax=Variovorax sp. PCZ-1 TaxID=2835533 RepID=UPI001BCBAFBE|nr:hydroxyacylglutathione hydrolase [Variovorax sp. PCZ-1]MBS7807062.1 hydroxyacylglutathione hydrolase [Variovorax sp. PCZ-1]